MEEETKVLELLAAKHPSEINPGVINAATFPRRIAQAATVLQSHVCTDYCLRRKFTVLECKKQGFDPTKMTVSQLTQEQVLALMRCTKGFPKHVRASHRDRLTADPKMEFTGIVRYQPCRDDPSINNYNPVFLDCWGANIDQQIMHPGGMFLGHQ